MVTGVRERVAKLKINLYFHNKYGGAISEKEKSAPLLKHTTALTVQCKVLPYMVIGVIIWILSSIT